MRYLALLSLATYVLGAPIKQACYIDENGTSHCTAASTTISTLWNMEDDAIFSDGADVLKTAVTTELKDFGKR